MITRKALQIPTIDDQKSTPKNKRCAQDQFGRDLLPIGFSLDERTQNQSD